VCVSVCVWCVRVCGCVSVCVVCVYCVCVCECVCVSVFSETKATFREDKPS